MEETGRRRSSTSSVDRQKIARLQQLKVFQQGGLGSKIFKVKAQLLGDDESAASALSKAMTRKKGGEVLQLQVEIESETHWKLMMRREGLVLVEVYAGWIGPCVSMTSLLKKAKVDMNDDRLTLALANSDIISDLKVFKNQSEPAWVFFGGGKPVRLIRGVNAAKLLEAIKLEFAQELLCMEGKAKRTLISLSDEAERRKIAENEALRLALEDKIRNAAAAAARKAETEKVAEESTGESLLKSEEMEIPPVEEEVVEGSEVAGEERRDSNLTLMDALEKYTVIALQNFILETGAVTEIKDYLRGEFKIIQERYIVLQEEGVRKLFGIPYHLEIPVEEEEEEAGEDGESQKGEEEGQVENSLQKPGELQADVPSRPTSRADRLKDLEGDGIGEGEENEGDGDSEEPEVPKAPKVEIVPVALPEELVGDTLLFLLESLELQKLMEQKTEEQEEKLPTADDFIRKRVGPEDFKEAKESAPESLHGLYGREEYVVGVWCPRSYDDKRYVMLNFFPRFVTEMLLPPPKEIPKYIVAIFPSLFAYEIIEHPQLVSNRRDVLAQGKVALPPKLLDRMLKSKGISGEDVDMQKKTLTGFDMFAVSVNARNPAVVPTLISLEPLHLSVDCENGMYETAKLFPELGVLIEDDSPDDEDEQIFKELVVEKFLGRSSKPKLEVILDDESGCSSGDGPSNSAVTEDTANSSGEVAASEMKEDSPTDQQFLVQPKTSNWKATRVAEDKTW